MQHWGVRLQQALKTRGVRKSYALAYQMGVNESAISRWKRGGAITITNAVTLAQILDVTLDWLLTGRGPMDIQPIQKHSSHRTHINQKLDKLPLHAIISLSDFLKAFENK